MILLNGHSLSPVKKVPLEALSLQLKERDSTATMTPADMDGITVNSWLKDEGNPGDGIVWRISSIRDAYATRTKTINLEHAIATLKDTILFGEHGPAQITGNSKATSCTAEQAVRYILSKQSDWVLGSFGYSVSNPYKFDGNTLFEALETVSDSLGGAWWSYDFSVYPFRLNINQGSTRTESELRAGRNLRTIQKTIDKSGMYTRFYPIGADDLHIDGDYVELNTNLYGVISKVETDSSIDSKAELRRWATERLAIHAEPTVTIDVEGLELADATGETMDRLRLGYYCRVPLPEFNTTINERIITLNYPDKIHQPEMVRITLANNREDITKIVAKAIKKSGKSARTKAKKDKKDLAWFEDTNDHVSMCAKGIVGVDAAGNPNWIRLTELVVDGNGLSSKVSSIQNDVIIAQSEIEQQERSIGMVVRQSDPRPRKSYVDRSKFPAVGSSSYLYYDSTNKKYYEWKNGTYVQTQVNNLIEAGKICVAINESGESEATIKANKIYLLGQTIANTISANYIQSKIASIALLNVQGLSASASVSVQGQMRANSYYVGTGQNSRNISDPVLEVRVIPIAGTSNYRLQYKSASQNEWTGAGDFSRATTQKISGSWSGGVYTVSADDEGSVPPINTTIGMDPNGGSWSGGTYTQEVKYTKTGTTWQSTGITAKAYVREADIVAMGNTAGQASEPSSGTTVWEGKTFVKNYWYTFNVTVHGRTKTFKVKMKTTD